MGPSSSSCGYCHTDEDGRFTHGIWAHSLTCDDYQALIDRGWRRSGHYVYKPHMKTICCPQYTIRLEADRFRPSKKHRSVLRRMERYLAGEWEPRAADKDEEDAADGAEKGGGQRRPSAAGSVASSTASRSARALPAALVEAVRGELRAALGAAQHAWAARHPEAAAAAREEWAATEFGVTRAKKAEQGEAAVNAALVLAARLRRALQPAPTAGKKPKGPQPGPPAADPMAIAGLLAEQLAAAAGAPGAALAGAAAAAPGFVNLTLSEAGKALAAAAEAEEAAAAEAAREAAAAAAAAAEAGRRAGPRRTLAVAMVEPAVDDETFELYAKYQVAVHGDKREELSKESFGRFLVNSPLIRDRAGASGAEAGRPRPPLGFGSFHAQYRVDGRLVAVGVVDVLPRCLSSVYFYYDPELKALDLGTWGALQEIEWVQKVGHPACPPLAYYYLGYYIHTCPKMRYKGQYEPSELLCPEEYTWHPLEPCARLLDAAKYARFAPPAAEPAAPRPAHNPDDTPLLVSGSLLPLKALRGRLGPGEAGLLRRVEEYAGLVGPALARRMAYVLQLPDADDDGGSSGSGGSRGSRRRR